MDATVAFRVLRKYKKILVVAGPARYKEQPKVRKDNSYGLLIIDC